ncbi:MAG TPA: aspartyl protease family protein [Steroidobacteraceae bacterium]|nr:aspartyl protease family protein [Steroidobacteraceae bacterium]
MVPLTLRDNFAVVVVEINGKHVPLVLDTGNSVSLSLTKEAMERSGAIPLGDASKGMDVKGNLIESPRYKIARVQIGTAVFTDVIAELDVHDSSYQATQVGQEGFLGTELLKGSKVILDYPHRRMTLTSPANHSADCDGVAVPFSPEWDGEPATEVVPDAGRLVVWWDTGTPVSVLSRRYAQQSPSGVPEDTVTSKKLLIGGVDFGPQPFEVWDMSLPPGFDGFIGYDFFASHVVCMDFPANKLVIQKSKK